MTLIDLLPFPCNANLTGPSLTEMCSASSFLVFMTFLDKMVRKNKAVSGSCERVKSVESPGDEYDFVVIGGGAAGSVVAGRLSENPDWKILLLEAGPDEPPGAEIPSFTTRLIGTSVDWNYRTSNESHACLSKNGSCSWPSGKMLGGSTSHNGMAYIRGILKDFDKWAELGNEGWSWDDVRPYFLISEDNGEIDRVGTTYHGKGGPLPVEKFPYQPPFLDTIFAAACQAGYPVLEDHNADRVTGFAISQTTSKHGVRRSTAAAFLRPVRNRKNLHVSLNSRATRVIVENQKAVGVEYYQNGESKKVRVSQEVVLSAGTKMSPHILLHSGIGPKPHLEAVGVDVVKDLPGVGENLQDHVSYTLSFTINETDSYDNNYVAATEYFTFQSGPMSSTGLVQVTGRIASSKASPDFPDIQMYFIGYDAGCAPGKVGARRSAGQREVGIHVIYLHPKSRGRISLASKDPLAYPMIWGNYLSASEDLEVLVEAVELALGLAETKAFRAHNFTLSTKPLEACSQYTFPSKEYWACAIKQGDTSEYHEVGSCKMGPSSDPMAVVDSELRVHGIKGLRVADASIMPQVISGNTAATTIMIGERVAHFIGKKSGCRSGRGIRRR